MVDSKKLTQANFEAIRNHIFDRIHKSGEEIKNDLPNLLRTAIQTKAWSHFADADGKRFTNLVDWLHNTFPNGASMGQGKNAITYAEAMTLTEGHPDVHRALARNAPNNGRGGDRKSGSVATNQKSSTTFDRNGRTGTKAVLTARLAQEKPDFYNAYLRGEYRTITAAATAAGIIRNKTGINLRRAKSAFRKMIDAERKQFREWLKTDEARQTPRKTK